MVMPTASAAVRIEETGLPEATLAGRAFEARVTLVNDGAAAEDVLLLAALYRGSGDACGERSDPRFHGFTHLVQQEIRVPARARLSYPPEGERWLHRYDAEGVPEAPAAWEHCVFVARSAPGPAIDYEDFASSTLSVRARNTPPVASFSLLPEAPRVSEDVRFAASAEDPEGDAVSFRWDFGHVNASGRATATGAAATHFFYPAGTYRVVLVASDGLDEARVEREVRVLSPGEAPVVTARGEGGRGTPLPAAFAILALALAARRRA